MVKEAKSPFSCLGSPGLSQPTSAQKARVVLCSENGNDLAPLTCSVCKHCVNMIRKEMADQLVMDNKTSVISMGKDRLLSRHSDAVEPTLAFYAEEMSVAHCPANPL